MYKTLIFGFLVAVVIAPVSAEAKYRGEVAAWVPYWLEDDQVEEVINKIDQLDVIYPFVYEVNSNGELVEKVDIDKGVWKELLEAADDDRVDVIPTVAWFDGPAIHKVLSDRHDRRTLINDIDDLVDDNNFDGINIDFEQKESETIDYFSQFLEDLEDKLGRDDLTCTVEARMRPDHRWTTDQMPAEINYANDYDAMNKYCDWVEIMAYDQQRADIVLNKERRGVPYNPVADIDWVEHVIDFALESFDEDKIVLGIPTYGRAWDVTVAPEWYRDYTRVASVNYSRIEELEEIYDVERGRTAGGEGIITYFPEDSVWKIFNQLPTPEGTPTGYEAAAKALLVANYANVEIPVRMLTFGDAEAAEDKLDLAKKLDLKGVAFFSFNGEEDPAIWNLF